MAEQAKHTPGPWSVGPTHRESEGKSWLFFSHQTHVLQPDGADLAVVYSEEEEGHANARLIAAAPELLEALEGLLASHPVFRLRLVGAAGSLARLEQEAQMEAEDKAIAAVAKAKGA